MRLTVSVCVCTYNEEKRIRGVLNSILDQQITLGELKEIIVVSSGSIDRTNEIVLDYSRMDERIRLLIQEKREGKASAINLFLTTAKSDIFVFVSADVIISEGTFDALIMPFENRSVGMVTGRPIPDNNPHTFMGFATHLIWKLHHHLQLESPKANEILAMRPVVKKIDEESAVDDLQLEALVKANKYLIVYAPDAVVINHGPETVRDLVKQRRRIIAGHLHSWETIGYLPITMYKLKVLCALLHHMEFTPKKLFWTLMTVVLEVYIRLLANLDYFLFRKKPYKWDIAMSTKKVKN